MNEDTSCGEEKKKEDDVDVLIRWDVQCPCCLEIDKDIQHNTYKWQTFWENQYTSAIGRECNFKRGEMLILTNYVFKLKHIVAMNVNKY